MNSAFPEQLCKEKIEALFAQLINKFSSESEKLIELCAKLTIDGEVDSHIKNMYTLEWEDANNMYEILDQLNQVLNFYLELFANKTKSVVFSKTLMIRIFATIFEQFIWIIKNCFHKRNAFKKFVPKILKLEVDQMKRRTDTKSFLTNKASFSALIQRDFECFQNFLENANFYIPKSNQVIFLFFYF